MFPLRTFPQLMIEEEARSLREGDLEMRLKKTQVLQDLMLAFLLAEQFEPC